MVYPKKTGCKLNPNIDGGADRKPRCGLKLTTIYANDVKVKPPNCPQRI